MGHEAMGQGAEADEQRRGHAAVRVQVRAMSELEPEPARNREQQNYGPADRERRWNRGEKRQPLPERHPEKGVSDQALRKFTFDLVSLDGVV